MLPLRARSCTRQALPSLLSREPRGAAGGTCQRVGGTGEAGESSSPRQGEDCRGKGERGIAEAFFPDLYQGNAVNDLLGLL